jgi:hypothetical protein
LQPELTLDGLRSLAELAGLKLPEDELASLLPGVNRAKKQAAELRELIAPGDEPASIFALTSAGRK